jgi:hypothetical protein
VDENVTYRKGKENKIKLKTKINESKRQNAVNNCRPSIGIDFYRSILYEKECLEGVIKE